MLGFNRRFAPFIKTIKAQLTNQPLAINYRINAGILPPNHWVHHPEIGGGRILGEVCHFIDLVTFISHSKIKSIHSSILSDSSSLNDTLTISIKLENGSVASIAYFSNGNNNISKEHLEVFQSGNVFVIDDFKTLSISSNNKKKVIKSTQDKGHKNELFEFVNALKNGEQMPISFDEIYHSMQNTFKVIENCS
jgi:polar amino acid transport system substrate-binding protein